MPIRCRIDRALACAALLAPAAAHAEDLPWLGLWGGPECASPLRLGSAEVTREGATCGILAIVPLGATGATALRVDCGGAVGDLVVMYDRGGDRLWLWDDPDRTAPRLYLRCD